MHCKQVHQQIDCLPQPVQLSPDLTQHTAQCSSCTKFLEKRMALHNALNNLRAETATLGPSTHVEQQVLAALEATTSNPRRTRNTFRWITVSAFALVALLIAAVFFKVSTLAHNVAPMAEVVHEEPFTAMPYVIPPTPYERTTVIRTQVSVQIMQYAGFQVHDDSGSTTLADVLYGEDGRILALRLVTPPNHAS